MGWLKGVEKGASANVDIRDMASLKNVDAIVDSQIQQEEALKLADRVINNMKDTMLKSGVDFNTNEDVGNIIRKLESTIRRTQGELIKDKVKAKNQTITTNIYSDKNLIQKQVKTTNVLQKGYFGKTRGRYAKTTPAGEDFSTYRTETTTNPEDTWVRWGWFEDNILSKFFGLVDVDGNPVSWIRSIVPTGRKFSMSGHTGVHYA